MKSVATPSSASARAFAGGPSRRTGRARGRAASRPPDRARGGRPSISPWAGRGARGRACRRPSARQKITRVTKYFDGEMRPLSSASRRRARCRSAPPPRRWPSRGRLPPSRGACRGAGFLQAPRRRHEREEHLLLVVRHRLDAQGGGKTPELDALTLLPSSARMKASLTTGSRTTGGGSAALPAERPGGSRLLFGHPRRSGAPGGLHPVPAVLLMYSESEGFFVSGTGQRGGAAAGIVEDIGATDAFPVRLLAALLVPLVDRERLLRPEGGEVDQAPAMDDGLLPRFDPMPVLRVDHVRGRGGKSRERGDDESCRREEGRARAWGHRCLREPP